MKKIGFKTSENNESSEPEKDPINEIFGKRKELAIRFIESMYTPIGYHEDAEFKTTLELEYEMQNVIETPSMNIISSLMSDAGFQLQQIEGIPHWVLYQKA